MADIMVKEFTTISPWSSIKTAIEIMENSPYSTLPVVDGNQLVGVITSRDIRHAHPNRLVADAMTKNPITVSPKTSLWEAKEKFEQHRVKCLLVVEEGQLVGLVTALQVLVEVGKYIDPMTNLPRAEYLFQKACDLLKNGQEIAIIFIDLDDFGYIDKNYGHVTGDQVLREVAKLLREAVPPASFLCRYAGDEFALVLTASQIEAREVAVRLVQKINGHTYNQDIRLSASAGVAGGRRCSSVRPQSNTRYTVSDLINMASLASTRAKRENRSVVVAGSLQLAEVS